MVCAKAHEVFLSEPYKSEIPTITEFDPCGVHVPLIAPSFVDIVPTLEDVVGSVNVAILVELDGDDFSLLGFLVVDVESPTFPGVGDCFGDVHLVATFMGFDEVDEVIHISNSQHLLSPRR